MSRNRAFEAENGFLIENGPFVTGGTSSPVSSVVAQAGDLYVQNSGSKPILWQCTGPTNTDWRQLSAEDIPFSNSSLTTNSPDLIGQNQLQQAIQALSNRDFGKNFNQSYTSGNFTTTSTTFVNMQTIPSTAITSGDYIIFFHGRFLKTLLPARVGVRMQVNGNTVMDEEEISMDDDDYFFGHNMFVYVPNLTGNITVTAQVRKITGGGDVEVESRTLMYWRVS